MERFIKYIGALALTAFAALPAAAQQETPYAPAPATARPLTSASELLGMTAEDYSKMQLPPLEELFENARNNPAVTFYNLRSEEEARVLKSQRRDWLSYFSVGGNYQYGVTGMNTQVMDGLQPSYIQYSNQARNWWSVGGFISIPLNTVIDRRNQIKRQELRMQQTQQEIGKWYDEQKLRIIEAYTTAVQQLAILRIKAEASSLATAQYRVSEADFINGRIDAPGLSRQKTIQSNAVGEYELARAQLNNSLLQLEVLSNTKIINK